MKGLFVFGAWILLLCYFLWAWRRERERVPGFGAERGLSGKRGGPLHSFLSPGVRLFIRGLRRCSRWKLGRERQEELKKIYVGVEEEELFYCYYTQIGVAMASALMAGLLTLALALAVCGEGGWKDLRYIQRQGAEGAEKSVTFQADNGKEQREISVEIPKREYTDRERAQAFSAVKKEILRVLPGENASLEKVKKPLVLLTEVSGYAVDIRWELGDDGLIGQDGSLENENLQEPAEREITAVLSSGGEEQRIVQALTVYPRSKSAADKFWTSWETLWRIREKESRTEARVSLPEKVEGMPIRYRQKYPSAVPVILAATGIFLLLAPVWQKNRTREEIRRRQEQLRRDYPEFVEHFVLLVGAGLTVRGSWERMVEDYRKRGRAGRYVYEEMALTLRELDCGMSESRAYELFGKRTGLLSYMKFCTLIVQNLRKGSSDLLQLLDYEVADAFHQRRESAKELGEKAGTKLLLPMTVMLALVFAIILYAAFRSM